MTDANDNNGTTPKLNFIADNAAEEDAFNSHSRIATAVAGVIRQKKDLKVIGLLGSWGSGKSTVVKFIQKRLKADHGQEKVHSFTYDAWLHQSDPPRRAFLENLIRFLIDEGLTTEARWEERIRELNRQIEDTETTSTPTLSTVGRFLLLSALLVPIGMTFIGHDWFEATSKAKGTWLDHNAFRIGWALIFAPAFIAAGFYVAWRPTWKFWQGRFWTTHRAPYERESILSISTNREVVHQKNRTIKTPDPTTIEFQTIFREIMGAVFAERRRFIFVVDNLDRLPEAQAVELWATIRSFFLGADQKLNLPTVILPIDEKAVERMYTANHPDQTIARSLAQSFMDKTFDLKFYVSRPVLSDWNKYLGTQMAALFGPRLRPEWPHQVQVILDRWLLSDHGERETTPRSINTLLNSIGTLWLQWHSSDIGFASIAYYAVHRDRIGSEILSEVSKGDVGLADEDSNWQISLASLHYGVEPDQAAQVLLERPLTEAIRGGSEADFARCATVPGFASVFERILDRENERGMPAVSANAIRLYNALDLPEDTTSIDAWRRLRTLYAKQFDTSKFIRADVDALTTAIARCPEADMSLFLAAAAARMSAIDGAAFSKTECIANYVDASRIISTKACELGVDGPKFTIQGDPRSYLNALTLTSDEEPLLKCLRSNAGGDKIIDALSVMVADSGTIQGADTCTRALKIIGEKLQWQLVIDTAGAKLEGGVDSGTAIAANSLGYLFATENTAKARVQQLLESGNLQARFHEAFNGENIASAASIAALLLVSNNPAALTTPDGAEWPTAFASRKGLAEEIGRQLSAFGGPSDFEAYTDLADKHPSVASMMKAIASWRFRNGDLMMPDPAEVAVDFNYYSGFLDDDLSVPFASKVGESPEFWTELARLDLAGNEPTYLALLDESCTQRAQAAKAISEKLKLVTADRWQAAINSGAEPYGLTIALASADATANLDGNLFEALRVSIPTLCSNDDAAIRERWFELIAQLKASLRKTLFRGVTDHLTASDTATDLVALFSAQENALLREGELGKKADGAARNVVIPLLGSGYFDWLYDHSEAFMPVLVGCTADTREAIAHQLRVHWDASDTQEAKDRIDLLRSNWSLPEFTAEAVDEDADE